ncbi:MAG: DUF4175 family protein [Deltaproteobacteria bacterium]|nr:DUF4175 family protein [Deltaproteobacteria bacterium]
MEPFDATLGFLARVRRELASVSRAETLLLVVLALVGTAGLGLGLAALLGAGPGRWAWVVMAAGVAGVGLIVWRFWVVPRRHRAVDQQLALWVEERVPLGSGLVTAVETGALIRTRPPEALGFSPKLATEAAARAATVLAAVRPEALPDRRRLGRLRWGAVATAVLAASAILLAPDLWARGLTNLVAPSPYAGEDGERLVDVAVSQLDLEVRPPRYTGLEPRKLPRSSGDVEALVGSEIQFTTTALFPATGAALVLQSDPESRWLLPLESDGTIKGTLQVGESDRYQFVLTVAKGQVVRERVWRHVTAAPDRAPEVTLLLPEQDLEVKPDDTIDFFYEASDDLGIDKVELVVLSDSGDELTRKAVSQAHGNRIDKGNTPLGVAALGLEPGQAVDVHFEVADHNKPPGVGKSQARRIQLYSPQDEHDQLLARLEILIEQMIDVLADRLESPVDAAEPFKIADFVRLHQAIGQATEAVLRELESVLQGLSTDSLASDDMRDAVRRVLGSLRDVSEQEQAHLKKWVLDPDTADPRVLVSLLDQTNDEAINVFEQGILELKRLLDGALKDAIMEAGRELLDTQQEIMDLLKKLKETNDPAAREAVMKKLRQLQEKLRKLQQQMARAQERAPYENQNAAQRPNENQQSAQDMEAKMAEVQKLLEEGKIDEAMKLMEEMARSTQELMASLEDDLEGGGPRMSAASRKKMQEVQQQLNELADGQRGLQRETNELEEEIAKRQAEMMKERAEKAMDELKQLAQEIREGLDGVPDKALHSADQRALSELDKAAQEIQEALDKMEIAEAGGGGSRVADDAQKLGSEIEAARDNEANEGRQSSLGEAMKQLGKAEEAARELADKIEGMKPGPGQGQTPGQGQQLGELGKRQKELQQKLEQLGQKLSELEGELPGIGQELGQPLQEAGQKMGEAKGELEGSRPGPAGQRQQEAMEKLQEAQQQMQERMKRSQRDGGQDDESTGVNNPKAEVEIPKDDPYARPRKLREEILKMMDEQAPERYRDAIKKFYEDLTK